ncbi:hypothetical protein PSI19_11120 [Xenorhabdus khoisanae]|nr:hypothetical protein [Xenorhabdus khoisanae]MDC9614411.1 hypothetical protein [Xenorhabdus khoisanae]
MDNSIYSPSHPVVAFCFYVLDFAEDDWVANVKKAALRRSLEFRV